MTFQVFDNGVLVYTSGPAAPPVPTNPPPVNAAAVWSRPDGTLASVSDPFPGEGIMAFAARTSAQTGFPASAAGSLALGIASSTPFGTGADQSTWPKILDYLADPSRYGVANVAGYMAPDPVPYTGQIDPDTMGAGDWAFANKHGLTSRYHEIFSKKPVCYVDKVGSRIMAQGDYAVVEPVVDSWYIPNNGPLVAFI